MLTKDGARLVPYQLERSRRVKRMYLQFDTPQHVTLKLPYRYSEKTGIDFIRQHADWICGIMDSQPRIQRLQQYLVKHPRLSLGGRWYQLRIRFNGGRSIHCIDEEAHSVTISVNRSAPIEEQLVARLKLIARDQLTRRVLYWSARKNIKAHGITIRDQRGRWGSCSETGGISLNWRLILVAPELQDHVVLHELAHVRHFDHSCEFHSFLARLDPHSDQHSRQLDTMAARVFPLGRIL